MTSTAWNLKALREHIREMQIDRQLALEVITSIERSTRIFRYHMATARDALNGIVDERGSGELVNFELIFGVAEKQSDFEFARIVGEAHLIGCLHTARGLWDQFAQLLNLTVVSRPLSVKDCDVAKVVTRLSSSPLRESVNGVLESGWYQYVHAFINTTKHRHLVQHLFSISENEDRVGLRVGNFEYNGRNFDQYWAREVLEGVIEVKNGVVACGRFLNDTLGLGKH